MAQQIDFGQQQKQAQKNKNDLDSLEKIFPVNKKCNAPHEPDRICKQCGSVIPKKNCYPSQYREKEFCDRKCFVQYRGRSKSAAVVVKESTPNTNPMESKWKYIEAGMKIAGLDTDAIEAAKEIYELGFSHGSE